MLKKLRLKQLYIMLACLAAVVSFLPRSACAGSLIDTQQPVSLTLYYQKEQAVPNVKFSLYRVADISDTATFRLTDDFRAYQVSLEKLSSDDWRALAETLAAYAARDGLRSLDSGRTGSDGTLQFPNQQKMLLPGLYLVVGEQHTSGKYTYTPTPFLVCLPNLDEKTGHWVYDETVNPKYIWNKDDDTTPTINRKVLKVWEDNGNETLRPEQVVVQLLRNGIVWDTVTLSEKNNWRYLWTNLNAGDIWQVVEKSVPDGYTVSISREGITFVMTNTYHPEEPDTPDKPDEPNTPGSPNTPDGPNVPDKTDKPDKPDKPDEPGKPVVPSEPTIPQTGALWWPVPVLACSGMLLVLLGWVQKRGKGDDR